MVAENRNPPVRKGGRIDRLIKQNNELYNALREAMRYFDQVIAETGYQSEGERIAHEKAHDVINKYGTRK